MDPLSAPGRLRASRDESGVASIQFVVAAALAMVLVVGLTQVLAYQYAEGAALAAAERGVRAGAVVGGDAARCLSVTRDSLRDVLGGDVGESLTVDCTDDGDLLVARVTGTVPAWIVGGPRLEFAVETLARREVGS